LTEQAGRRRLLFVCTANICRSPTAELIAREHFGESAMVFRSAGFLHAGESCPSELVSVLGARSINASDHRSYQLDQASLDAAELLLTMEGRHVQKATMISPDSFPKIVPLREAAAVLDRMGGRDTTVEDFIAELNQHRDPRQYLGSQWDVEDPYGRRTKAYRKAVAEIDQLVTSVIGRLR
jgi:protein-tyrosine-phosphatase